MDTRALVLQSIRDTMSVLDEHAPGWRGRIDLNTLDIMSNTDCVLGQVFGDYGDGRDYLESSYVDIEPLAPATEQMYAYVSTPLWKEVLTA